jgi:replicative DNA helicase
MAQEKMLPQNIQAEEAVLGSLIIDAAAIPLVADFLKPEHFYRDVHQVIYRTIATLYNQDQKADFITLSDELMRQDHLEAAGLVSGFVNEVPTSLNIEYYAQIVLRTWKDRELIRVAGELAAQAYEQDIEALGNAEKALLDISKGIETKRLVSGGEAMNAYMSNFLAMNGQRKGDVLSGINTGFPLLNSAIGGFEKSKLYVLAAISGEGKTTLAFNFIDTAIKAGLNVLFFSLEMEKHQIMQRWIAMRGKVDSKHLRDNNCDDEELERVIEAGTEIMATGDQLTIDDTPGNTLTAMRAAAIRRHAEIGIDLIVMDYIGIAKVSNEERKFFSDRRLEVEEVVKGMKNLARELEVPVIALSQVNRETMKQASNLPGLHNLSESAAVEHNANVVMFIHKDQEAEKDATEYNVNLVLAKNRDGDKRAVPLRFVGKHTMFYPVKNENAF